MKYKRFAIECSKNYSAKIFRCPEMIDQFDFTLHWHRDYELIYVKKGPLRLQTLEKEIVLQDDEIYLLNSEEIHSYADVKENLRFTVINVPIKAIRPYFDYKCPKFRIKTPHAYNKIRNSLKNLEECENLEGRIETLKIKAVLNNVFYYLFKECIDNSVSYVCGSDSADFDCAKGAADYMEEHYKEDISLGMISSYVGMTPAHFSKYFKDKTETTFLKYLRRIRLEHAMSDMCEHDMSVKEAALNNGFPNVNSFIITCKEEYEKTPLEVKIQMKT